MTGVLAGTVAPEGPSKAPFASPEETERRVVELVRGLAFEVDGPRAAAAVSATASLERDVGLSSLERVELLLRLENAFGRELQDRFLLFETPRDIARALPDAPPLRALPSARIGGKTPAAPLRMDDVATLTEALRRRAAADPARVHVYLHGEAAVTPVSYGELRDGASRIAGALTARGLRPGERVAIMLPTGVDYLETFMGVLTAGAVAVPLYPPARLDRMAEYLQRQAPILANAEARLLVAMPEAGPVGRLLRGGAPALTGITTADALRRAGQPAADSAVSWSGGDDVLIQYTSGSTGDPKGVVLTHANLLANIRAIAAGIELRPTDVAVSWLPMYHDMGLIGTWLSALVEGVPLALMSPLAFLARPERWLWAIHQHRATLSPAPNFAYELCARKIRDAAIEGLDLSSWRCAFNGSEPVSPATLDHFAERFAGHGFRREAFAPVYGLAESSVALCLTPPGRGPLVDRVARAPFEQHGRAVPAAPDDPAAVRFTSVGRPIAGHEVRLVDERGDDVPERVMGRLIFRGPSCTRGYHRNPEATARTLRPGGWLDSGDLAYRADGEFFVTGRAKDLIITGGRNLVPQEIEEVAGAVTGVRKGCVAAFGVADERRGTERLVVLAESHASTSEERDRLERDVVAGVAASIGVPPDVVRVLPPGSVPKTPSGKIRRSAAREAYLSGRIGARRAAPLRLRFGLVRGAAADAGRTIVRRIARALYAAYLVIASTVVVALVVPPLWILERLVPAGRPVRTLSRFACRVALAITGVRVDVEGREHLTTAGPLVLVANHTSYADTPALIAALPLDFIFVAMTEILSWPIVGGFVRRAKHPTVDRFHPQRSVADAAAIQARLAAGEAVLFFPEGGFSAATGLRPFKLGAFEAAVAAGAPVVPLALRGSRQVLRGDARLPHPGRVHVWIGAPLRSAATGWDAGLDLRARAAAEIAAHCGEPRLDAAPAVG